jgi:protein phosphatase
LNEDDLFVGEHLWLVTDGMGGHTAGDEASRITRQVVSGLDGGQLTADSIRAAVGRANDEVLAFARMNPTSTGLGCTIAGLARLTEPNDHWAVFNVGDSRVYGYDDGALDQLTVDHSEVAELVAAGVITLEEAATHPARHIVTRAIGEVPAPEVDIIVFPCGRARRFVICSDGLTSEVGDVEIAAMLAANDTAQHIADRLVRRAIGLGGRDNVTVVVVDEPPLTMTAADTITVPRSKVRGEW